MKKVIIKNSKTNEELPYFTTQENPEYWINNIISSNICGLPERIVDDIEGTYNEDDVLEKFEITEKEATEDSPAIVKNKVKLKSEYTIEVTDISYEYNLQECISKRKSEYPSMEEFMNAYFDGGEGAVHNLQVKRLEVKAKYPKPVKE